MCRCASALFLFLYLFVPAQGKSADFVLDIFRQLEYDQEIRGLFIPHGWTPWLRGSLYIGSAKMIPDAEKLYSLGWKPALHLESVTYRGSSAQFFELAQNLAKNNRTNLYLRRVQTSDRDGEFDCTISKDGNVKFGL